MSIRNVGFLGNNKELLRKMKINYDAVLCPIFHKGYKINFIKFNEQDIYSGLLAIDCVMSFDPDAYIELAKKYGKPIFFIDDESKSRPKTLHHTALKLPIEQSNLLTEVIAENDDKSMESYIETNKLSKEEFNEGFKRIFKNGRIHPVFKPETDPSLILDFIIDYTISPEEISFSSIDGKEGKSTDDSLIAFVFKTKFEQGGKLSYIRIFSGTMESGEFYNSTQKHNERVSKILPANKLNTGDIGILFKLKSRTGDTLVNKGNKFELPRPEFPEPLVSYAVELVEGKEDKLMESLQILSYEDLMFSTRYNEFNETIIDGQSEAHIKEIIKELATRFNLKIKYNLPRIPYRETIKRTARNIRYRHKKQTGGAGQFAEVEINVSPNTRGNGIEFTDSLVGQNVDRGYVPSVEKGINQVCQEGIFAGYKITDIKIDFCDGKMHPVDSSDIAFQIASKEALKKAFWEATPILLEPICKLEIQIPEEFIGDVIGDILGRRGKITKMDETITAEIPMQEIQTYKNVLDSITQGRGKFKKTFSHYEEMPEHLARKIKQ